MRRLQYFEWQHCVDNLKNNLKFVLIEEIENKNLKNTVANNSYHFWADLVLRWLFLGYGWYPWILTKMPWLPCILIRFSWAKSHTFFTMENWNLTCNDEKDVEYFEWTNMSIPCVCTQKFSRYSQCSRGLKVGFEMQFSIGRDNNQILLWEEGSQSKFKLRSFKWSSYLGTYIVNPWLASSHSNTAPAVPAQYSVYPISIKQYLVPPPTTTALSWFLSSAD